MRIASLHKTSTAIVADNLALPHPSSFFDFAISIAVIHHFSTLTRRVEALAAVLDTLRPSIALPGASNQSACNGGRALIFVWALEQKTSRRDWGESDEQDVMVPWVMKQKSSKGKDGDSATFHRYYHLYCSGELERDIIAAGGVVVESGYEKDNWWAIALRPQVISP